MRSISLLFALLLASGFCCAQSDHDYYGPYAFEPGAARIVFSDTVLVRGAPGGVVKDTLYEFASVHIVRQLSDVLTVGRKTAPWYEVAYTVRAENRAGFLWGGALALEAAERDGLQVLFNALSYPQPAAFPEEDEPSGTGHNTCAVKARRIGEQQTQQCLYTISRESASFLDTGRDEDGKIFYPRFGKAGSLPTGARFLVHFYMSGEACGIPSYQITAAWDGVRLIRMPMLESNVDGGTWSYSEEYVYPTAKGGRKGHLSIRGVSEEYSDEGSAEPKLVKRTVTLKHYRWDEAAHRFVAAK